MTPVALKSNEDALVSVSDELLDELDLDELELKWFGYK